MKRIVNITILMFLASSVGFSQGDQSKKEGEKKLTVEERADKRTEKMTELLSLTDTQKESVYKINLKHASEMEKLKAEQKVLRDKMKKLHEETKAEMEGVLSAEQQAIMEAKHEEMKKKRDEKKKDCHH